jgi:hypothetical protein
LGEPSKQDNGIFSKMKTIFITIYDADIAKNIMRTDVWSILKSASGLKFVLLAPPAKAEYYKTQFGGPNVFIESFEKLYPTSILKIFHSLYRHTLPVVTTRIDQDYLLAKSKANILKYIAVRTIYLLSFINFVRRAFQKIGILLLPQKPMQYLFDRYKPDLVFAPNIIAYEEGNLVRTAKRNNILTIGMIKSWDTTSTKGLLRVLPDYLIAPNKCVARESVEFHNMPEDRVFVSGVPQYDLYLRKENLMTRDKFIASIGADPAKKLIFYCAIGDWLAPNEDEIIKIIDNFIEEKKIRFPSQILVRPHPKYPGVDGKLSERKNVIFNRPGTYISSKIDSWEFEYKDILHLANSIANCDLLITTASSMTIESCVFDKPVINIGFDGYKNEKPPLSVSRFYRMQHFKPVVKSGGVKIVYSKEDLPEAVNSYLANPFLDSEGRKTVRDIYCVRPDGDSCKRIADYILSHLPDARRI